MERIVWIGPDHPAAARARASISRLREEAEMVAAESIAAASPYLATDRPVVVVDAAGGPEWARAATTLRLSTPTATLVAWSARSDHDALEEALAAGFDGSVAGDADWARPLRWARARAASRHADRDTPYHAFFERSPHASLIVEENGRVKAANAAFARLLGYNAAEFQGRSVLDLFAASSGWDDRAFFEEVLAGRSEGYRGEGPVVRRDGTQRWVELHLFASGCECRAGCGYFAVLEDITERKSANDTLRASEERFHAAFAHSGVAMSMLEVVESWVYTNPAFQAMFGVPPQMSIEQFVGLMHPEDRLIDIDLYHDTIDGRRASYQIEKRYVHPSTGETLWCLCTVSLERDAAGAPRRVFATVLDISNRRRAEIALREREEELRHSQKMEAVGRLAGGVAHDFNNLLMGIKGHVELLLQNRDWEDGVLEDLFEINHAAVRSQRLVQQLMAFSRKQVLQPEVLDLNELVDELGRMLERLLGEHVQLLCELDAHPARVTADQGQLEQVLVNLAVNARDAMPDGGTLSIRTSNEEGVALEGHAAIGGRGPAVVLTVTDTGTGMDEETQQHIFEPFFTTKGPDRGTGLGLATVYGIVKQSGGAISVASSPGGGSSFRIELPLSAPDAADTRPAVQRGATAQLTGSETVLLVEDEQMIRKLTRRMLQQCGYQVLDAASGPEALEICRAHEGEIHLLLTDIVMPQLRGRDLARQVAAMRPAVRIVYMSGYTGDQVLDLAEIEDEAAFLQKPVDLATLASTVRGLLDLPAAPGR